MGNTVREFLIKINLRDGFPITDDDLLETLLYSELYPVVYKGKTTYTTWYGISRDVLYVEGQFIEFTNYHYYPSDSIPETALSVYELGISLEDFGLKIKIDDMCFVDCPSAEMT